MPDIDESHCECDCMRKAEMYEECGNESRPDEEEHLREFEGGSPSHFERLKTVNRQQHKYVY